MIPLEAKENRTKAENDLLALHKRLIEVTKLNEQMTIWPVAVVMVLGLSLSWYGAKKWNQVIQTRDDKLADLQIRKLEAEVAKLEAEVQPALADRRLNMPPDASTAA